MFCCLKNTSINLIEVRLQSRYSSLPLFAMRLDVLRMMFEERRKSVGNSVCHCVCLLCVKNSKKKRKKTDTNRHSKVKRPYSSTTTRPQSVPKTGFEPAHSCERCDLNTVRLPISPLGLFYYN